MLTSGEVDEVLTMVWFGLEVDLAPLYRLDGVFGLFRLVCLEDLCVYKVG